ncbi:MAG: type III toxin-antitoxin system ToxN/AbiQ family toxin [Bacilli bacterium]|nr:type III toxin-antitoxin system ToxN/AbiQ family toxin [Bacilli bacterium]
MYKKFKIVKVDSKYCNYLRKFDNKVVYNAGKKDLRPFIGVLFTIENCEYFAPLSSPKLKHKLLKNTLDLVKICNGKYGVVNFNNMIPVTSCNYTVFDLN